MKKTYTPLQRKAALAAAIALLLLFFATLVVGVAGGPEHTSLLMFLLFLDVTVPAVAYGYLLIRRHAREREKGKEQEPERPE